MNRVVICLIILNVLSFLLYTGDYFYYLRTREDLKPKAMLPLITVLFGSAGAFMAILIWDKKIPKHKIFMRIFILMCLCMHAAICYFMAGGRI